MEEALESVLSTPLEKEESQPESQQELRQELEELQEVEVATPSPEDILWFALHTKPRCEKKLADWLKRQEVTHYLPTRQSLRVYPSKKVTFEVPVFPGYLFAKFSSYQKRLVLGNDYTANVLDVVNQKKFLQEMERVRKVLAAGVELEEHAYLEVGKRVVIASGKLKGVEGIIEEHRGKHRLVISVEMFQQAVCMEIDPRLLLPAV